MAGLLHIRHYIHGVPEPRSLEDVLGTAQRLGTLGALVALSLFVKRHERAFLARAEAECPGPLTPHA